MSGAIRGPGACPTTGVFLALDGWNAYFRRPINEEDIQAEMRRNQRGPTNLGA
jgi:hypothetical protein